MYQKNAYFATLWKKASHGVDKTCWVPIMGFMITEEEILFPPFQEDGEEGEPDPLEDDELEGDDTKKSDDDEDPDDDLGIEEEK